MGTIFLVGMGGFVGSVLRYLLSGYVQQQVKSIGLPHGTIVVNIIGCFIIGFLSQVADYRGVFTTESRTFVFVGVLGGFTTFSSFTNETMNLLQKAEKELALLNIGVQIIFGLLAIWVGRMMAALLLGAK